MSCLVNCVCRLSHKSEILACHFNYETVDVVEYPGIFKINPKDFPYFDYDACRLLTMPSVSQLTNLLLNSSYSLAAIGFNGHYALVLYSNSCEVYDFKTSHVVQYISTKVLVPEVYHVGIVKTKVLTFNTKQYPALLSCTSDGDMWKFYFRDGIFYLPKSECDEPSNFACSAREYWDIVEADDSYGSIYVGGRLRPFYLQDNRIQIERG